MFINTTAAAVTQSFKMGISTVTKNSYPQYPAPPLRALSTTPTTVSFIHPIRTRFAGRPQTQQREHQIRHHIHSSKLALKRMEMFRDKHTGNEWRGRVAVYRCLGSCGVVVVDVVAIAAAGAHGHLWRKSRQAPSGVGRKSRDVSTENFNST